MLGQIHQNGITESKTYDAASQLLANTHLNGSTPVSGHGYTLDSTGRRTAETFTDGTTPTRSYGYDTADQVASATYGSGLTDAYNYDSAGNRSTATIASLGGNTTTYTANNANQYSTISGMSAPSHDANGNLTSQNGVTYTWDSENRLLSVSDGTTTNTFTYDGNHRRVTKLSVVSGTTTANTHYVYDGWNVIEEYSLGGSPVLSKTLTWGSDLSGSMQGAGGVGGLLMVEEISGSTTTAYHFQYDGNGNVTEITDLSGNPAASYRYNAFGNTLVATGSYAATNKYRFSTKPLDAEVTNAPLYYYGYRFYDPVTGRWPSRDPIEEEGGTNLYEFSQNNGTTKFDILGLVDVEYMFSTPKTVSLLEMPFSLKSGDAGLTYRDGAVQCSTSNGCEVSCLVIASAIIHMNSNYRSFTSPYDFQTFIYHEKMHIMSYTFFVKNRIVYKLLNEPKKYENKEDATRAAQALSEKYTSKLLELALTPDHHVPYNYNKKPTKYKELPNTNPAPVGPFSPTKGYPVGVDLFNEKSKEWERVMNNGKSAGDAMMGDLLFKSFK